MSERWRIAESRYLVKDRWMTLRVDRCETASGTIVDPYYVQELSDWVNIAAFDSEQRLLLVEQYRHGCGEFTLELPAGCVEPNEPASESMRRELLEETGCEVDEYFELTSLIANPARATNRIRQFVGVGAKITSGQNLDLSEEIRFQFTPITEVLEMITTGAFPVASHIANIMMAIRYLNTLPAGRLPCWKRVAL